MLPEHDDQYLSCTGEALQAYPCERDADGMCDLCWTTPQKAFSLSKAAPARYLDSKGAHQCVRMGVATQPTHRARGFGPLFVTNCSHFTVAIYDLCGLRLDFQGKESRV